MNFSILYKKNNNILFFQLKNKIILKHIFLIKKKFITNISIKDGFNDIKNMKTTQSIIKLYLLNFISGQKGMLNKYKENKYNNTTVNYQIKQIKAHFYYSFFIFKYIYNFYLKKYNKKINFKSIKNNSTFFNLNIINYDKFPFLFDIYHRIKEMINIMLLFKNNNNKTIKL
tara:strand:- start:3725 stop:4237 length:513 start_codon:yes stop_codon:yes gene_type:complete